MCPTVTFATYISSLGLICIPASKIKIKASAVKEVESLPQSWNHLHIHSQIH